MPGGVRATGRPNGRPNELDRVIHRTPEGADITAAEHVLTKMRLGLDVTEAADTAGVSRTTLHYWRLNGARARQKRVQGGKLTQNDERYAGFLNDLENAQAHAHASRLEIIERATQPFTVTKVVERFTYNDEGEPSLAERTVTTETKPGAWTAAAWWLERKLPAQYGRRIELSGQVAGGTMSAEQRAEDLAQSLRAYLDGQADGLKAASEAGDKAKAPRL